MKVLELLEEFEERLETSSTIPFSGKIVIDREEINNFIKEIQLLLPDEMKHAKWIKDERNKIIEDANRDAKDILEEANAKEQEILSGAKEEYEELLDKHKLVELAKEKAEKIIAKAHVDSGDIRNNAFKYSQDIISKAYQNMVEITKLLEKNKEELDTYIKPEKNDGIDQKK